MRYFKQLLLASLAAFVLAFAAGCSDDDDDNNVVTPIAETTKIRVIHTSYDAPAVDVRVDGNVAISNLAYGQSSAYAELTAGVHNIKVSPTGATTPVVIEADLNLEANKEYTVYAVNELAQISAVVSTDMRSSNASAAKVRFLHASPGAPAVDIKLITGDGPAVFTNVAFEDYTDYLEVPGGSYSFAVTATGATDEVAVFNPITLTDGNVYTVIAHGVLGNNQYPFAVRAFVDNGDGNAFADFSFATTSKVLVTHASPDAPGVDLLIDGVTLNSAPLTFTGSTGYIDMASGTRNVKVNASGTRTSVIDADLSLGADNAYSVFAVDRLSNISPLVLEDDLTAPMPGMAHVRFVHLSPDAPAVDITLTDGTVVFGNKAFKEFTPFTPLNAGTYNLEVRLQGTDTVVLKLDGISLSDGTIYTVFAKGFVQGTGDQALGASIIVNN